ncbi:hypothetical protein KCU81_g2833, partial [Aureobasidium melanogenum]|uniref:Uncharacterized protein n=1 Tax=Aureobasidium melanogenum (strain CBS 110374) TaxID=1043003 RepID=A0A074VLB3_AURM1
MPSLPKFSYNVTRDYPYNWFTPAAILGGMFLTALFSAINFFSTAYNMVSVTTNQPQEIEAGRYGGSYAHFFASKIQPKCDDAVLGVGARFRTSRSVFEHQLSSSGSIGAPSMTYHNEVIDSCYSYRVMLDFSTYNRPASQINISAWGLIVTVDLNCYIDHHGDVTAKRFNLQTSIDPISSLQTGQMHMRPTWQIDVDAGHASAWAQVLMLSFWEETITAITNQTNKFQGSETSTPQRTLSQGYVRLDRTSGTADMRNDHYFDMASWVFFDATKNEKHQGSIGDYYRRTNDSYVYSTTWPNIWAPVDRLAKAAISAVYLDLGLSNPESPKDSMVSNADNSRYCSTNLSTIVAQSPIDIDISYMDSIVTVTDCDAQQQLPIGTELQLGTLPDPAGNASSAATIGTTYMCRQPQLKPPFNIFVSILVADLVFLRTAWSLYNSIVAYFLKSRHPDANICDECLARKKVEGKEETAHVDKVYGFDEHTIELDYLGAPSVAARRNDQGSTQSLLTHRHV